VRHAEQILELNRQTERDLDVSEQDPVEDTGRESASGPRL
jgi:hypothetical protein